MRSRLASEVHEEIRREGFACGHPVPADLSDGVTSKYATRLTEGGEEERICLDCALAEERAHLLKYSRAFGYLTREGGSFRVSTFAGGELARVTSLRWGRRYTWRGYQDCCFFRATDVHGQEWVGQGEGLGVYCRLRRARGGKA